MIVYKDTDDVVASVRRHLEKKIKECEHTMRTTREKSHEALRAGAARAAYRDVLWLMTDYTLSDAPEPSPQVAP